MAKALVAFLFMTARRAECCFHPSQRRKKNASHLMSAMIYSLHLAEQAPVNTFACSSNWQGISSRQNDKQKRVRECSEAAVSSTFRGH
jgi:hypothetical protein